MFQESLVRYLCYKIASDPNYSHQTQTQYGFEHVQTKHIYRLNIFFLIAMLATFLAWIIGWLAEKVDLQAQYQANSTKSKRVLSLFYLGYRIILRKQNDWKDNII